MAHGWTLGAELWDDAIALLTEEFGDDVRIVTYDNRGHGRSDAGGPGSAKLEQLADDLRAVIDAYAPDGPLILVGHSMGGMALLAFVERHLDVVRDRVRGTAFVCTSPGRMWSPFKRAPGFYRLAPYVLGMAGPRRLGPAWLIRPGLKRGLYGGVAERRHLDETIRQMKSVDSRAFADLGVSMMRHERDHLLSRLDGITTVVFTGSRDRLTPPRHGRRIAEGIDGAVLVSEPGAGHMVPCERSVSVARELAAMARAVIAQRSAVPIARSA